MVYFTGDIHGSPFKLQVFCRYMELTEKDTIVILGDVGANYYGGKRDKQFKEQIAKLAPTIFCIHGNHEQRPANIPSYKAKEWNDGPVWYEEEYPNLLFARDGNIYVIDGVRYLVIGGAFSVDKNYRLSRGYGWWADEQPSEEIKARVGRRVANSGLDVILSHACLFKYEPREAILPGIDQSEVDSSTEEWLDTIEESVDYKAWFCGHWHIDKRIDKMHFLYDEFESDEWLQTMIKEEQNG